MEKRPRPTLADIFRAQAAAQQHIEELEQMDFEGFDDDFPLDKAGN